MSRRLISARGERTRSFKNFFRSWGGKARQNSYHKQRNVNGIVNLGLAENTLCEDIMMERLRKDDMLNLETRMLYYSNYSGEISFRTTVARFLSERLKTDKPIDPKNMIITNGAGSALDLLAHVLADPGECFLSPAPYYTRIKTDFAERSEVNVLDVPLNSEKGPGDGQAFELTAEKLESAYNETTNKGLTVRGIILLNPSNPTGDVYNIALIKEILQLAHRHELHVILDEIYALSVFDEATSFQSVLTITDLPDPQRTHFVWGFSKDFSVSGFRSGVLYSFNSDVIDSITPLMYFESVPYLIQKKLENLISDTEWLDNVFFPSNLSRMKTAFDYCAGRLTKMGVEVYPSKAAYFIWANFSKFVKPYSAEGQMTLFKQLFEKGVYIVPGSALYHDDPGWFRIVFTHPPDVIDEGLKRMSVVLNEIEGIDQK